MQRVELGAARFAEDDVKERCVFVCAVCGCNFCHECMYVHSFYFESLNT